MSAVPDNLRPGWDRRFPGRLDWEIERLRAQARNVHIDQGKLASGTVQVDLEWPVRGAWIPVQASFPDSYPDTRPHVLLKTDRGSWPLRHVSPLDGSLCLLGRDPRQWRPEDGLAGLLMLQLETVLHGGGAEDPQAEPMEFWWNQEGLPDSYCLIDSDWDLSSASSGTLSARLVVEIPRVRSGSATPLPAFRLVATEVRSDKGDALGRWVGPLPMELAEGRAVTLRWVRSDTSLVPGSAVAQLTALRDGHRLAKVSPTAVGHGVVARGAAFIHPIELTEGVEGDGWIVVMEWGQPRDFAPAHGKNAAPRSPRTRNIPVFRAGLSDMGSRVPAFAALAGKKVAIIGVGALGAPIALELARTGVEEVRLLDHDSVEPGNSVRWPLGAVAWGQPKVAALKHHIDRHYPRCNVVPVQHMVGGLGGSDDAVLSDLFAGCDLVIDASASSTVNIIVWRRTQDLVLPLIKVGATPEVRGGTVVALSAPGPCPICVPIARAAGAVEAPAGEHDPARVQPVGCAEATFVGAGYDLQELSMQAVRVAVHALQHGLTASRVYTLSLRGTDDLVIPPHWTEQSIGVQDQCQNH
jgi:molybdopterin/thiamine biosynthesis adenylyltransferase